VRARLVARLWRLAYRRQVASAFRTVPLYRERWALDGRTDPVLVAGRTGTYGGAIPAKEAQRRAADLVPLAGTPSRTSSVHNGQELYDPLLGVLGDRRGCGELHVDWRRVYVRETDAGLAFTLLWQRSPRLVDILTGAGGRVATCPRHGTPVVRP
jgi:hypothetical protein